MTSDEKPYFISMSAPLSPKVTKREKYFVIKKASPFLNLVQDPNQTSINIFKNSSVDGLYQFNYLKENPVGGMQTFMNYKNNKKRKNKTFKAQVDGLKKSNKEAPEKNNFFKQTEKSCERNVQDPKEQVFKKHQSYSFSLSKKKSKTKHTKPIITQPDAAKSKKQSPWIDAQGDKYHNKMAYLNEIYFKKPLNQIYGDQYFEYCLRNRYEEELPPPPYIYQLKENTHEEVQKNAFIKKIRNVFPGLKNRKKIVLKGNKIR